MQEGNYWDNEQQREVEAGAGGQLLDAGDSKSKTGGGEGADGLHFYMSSCFSH